MLALMQISDNGWGIMNKGPMVSLQSVVWSFVPVFLSAIPAALFGVIHPADPIPVILAFLPIAATAIVGFYWRIRLAMS